MLVILRKTFKQKLSFKLETDVTHIGIVSGVCLITQLIVVCPVWVFSVIVRYAAKGIIIRFVI